MEIDIIQIEEKFDEIITKTKRLTKDIIELKTNEKERETKIIKYLENYLQKDIIQIDRVITIGKDFLNNSIEKCLKKYYRKWIIHHLEDDDIGKGACLRALEIEELFESGIEIECEI